MGLRHHDVALSQGSDTVSGIMLLGLVVFSIAFYPFVELASRRIKRKTLFFFTLGTFLVVIPMVTLSGMLGVPAWMPISALATNRAALPKPRRVHGQKARIPEGCQG